MRRSLPLVLAAVLLACGGAPHGKAETTTILSLQRIDCAECGETIVADLRARPGVYGATFDKQKAELTVVASPSFDVFTTVKSLAALQGWEVTVGPGGGGYVPPPRFPDDADVQTLARAGEDFPDLAAAVVPGKITIVDFTAAWCRPCHALEAHIATALGARAGLAYRKLEIGDWDSPLAQRYLRGVARLPYIIVFDRAGQKVRTIVGSDAKALDEAVAAAEGR